MLFRSTVSVKVQQSGPDSDEQMTPLDTKDKISIKVQQPGSDSDEQMTPLDTKDAISIKVQQSGPDSDGHPQSGEGECISSIVMIYKSIKCINRNLTLV